MLNYDKTYFLQFLAKTDHEINMQASRSNKNCYYSEFKMFTTDYQHFLDFEASY